MCVYWGGMALDQSQRAARTPLTPNNTNVPINVAVALVRDELRRCVHARGHGLHDRWGTIGGGPVTSIAICRGRAAAGRGRSGGGGGQRLERLRGVLGLHLEGHKLVLVVETSRMVIFFVGVVFCE